MEDSKSKPSRRQGLLYKVTTAIDNFMRRLFFKVGFFVAGRPILVIVLSIIFTIATLAGMLRFRGESRPQELWVPQNTVALDNFEYVRSRYGDNVRFSNLLFSGKVESSNLASKETFLECIKVAEIGFNTKGPVVEGSSTNVSFPSNCIKIRDSNGRTLCNTASPFGLFYDPNNVVEISDENVDVDFFQSVRKTVESMTESEIKQRLENGPFISPSGAPVDVKDIMSTKGSGSNFAVQAILYTQFNTAETEVIGGEEIDKSNDALEEAWMNVLLDGRETFDVSSITWEVQSTIGEENALAGALSGDLPKFSIGFVFLTIYVCLFLGDFHIVRSRQILGIIGLINAGLALGVTFGLGSAFGMFFGPVHQILPLLIIGIGVDDVFVVTRALDEVNMNPKFAEKSPRTRVALAISNAGSAITVTSVTNTIVFLLGAISQLPALRFFALWAAIGVVFDWGFTLTFYTGMLTLDTRRQHNKRRDCCPCFKISDERDPKTENNWFRRPPGGFSRFFNNQYGPLIMKQPVRILLITAFLALFGTCIWGCTQLYLKFDFSFFYPAGSDQLRFQNSFDEYFETGFPAPIFLSETDISTADNQRKYLKLCHSESGAIVTNKYIKEGSVDCWLQTFREVKGVVDEDVIPPLTFYSELDTFLNSPTGFRYKRDFIFKNGTFESVRFNALKVFTANNSAEIDALLSIREAADSVGFGDDSKGNPKAFTFFFQDLFTEQYKALPREIGISLGLASLAVAVICFQLVGHPIVALICFLTVGMIIIDVLGFTFFSGVNLNSVSVITIVIATGIAVDYVVHISRSFLEHVGTREERAIKALGSLGPPVFYAGFSTFLAIIVLAFATSYIFTVIFLGFLALIIIGLSHGLIFSPLILSLVGPPAFFDTEEEKDEAEMKLVESFGATEEQQPSAP